MAVSSFNKFNSFVADVANGLHNFGSNTIKAALTNTVPLATNTKLVDIAQIAAGGGYVTGGFTLTLTSSTQSGGLYKLVLSDYTFTATATVAAFRYVVLYNSSSTDQLLIGWYDYGVSLSMSSSETFLLDFDGTNGVFQIQ